MAFTGCSKEEDATQSAESEVSVTLIAESESTDATRTMYNGTDIIWSQGDEVSTYVNGIFKEKVRATISQDGKTASFKVSNLTAQKSNYIQGVLSAASDFRNDVKPGGTKVVALGMKIPTMQNAEVGSFDKEADALVMEGITLTPTTPTEEIPAQKVRFARPVAISKVTFKGFIPVSGETVKSVGLEILTEGKFLTGQYLFNPESRRFVAVDGVTPVADKNNIFHANATSSVVVNYKDVALDATFDAMFVTAPVMLAANDQIRFTFTTNKRSFTKDVTLTKEIAFSNSALNILSVDLTGVVPVIPDSSMTIDLAARNYGDKHDVTNVVGTDPLSVVFDKAKGSNPPKYYVAGGGAVRMYIDNTLTIGISDSTKKITKIVIETNNNNAKKSGAALKYDNGQLDDATGWIWENSNGISEVKFTAIKFNNKTQVPVKTITVFYK